MTSQVFSLLIGVGLFALAAVSSALLAYAGALLLRVERLLRGDSPAPVGLLLLSASEASAALLAVAGGEAAYLLYLFSSASFALGVAYLAWSRRPPRNLVAVPLLYAGAGDIVAGVSGIYYGLTARGPARILLTLAGASFLVRLAGLQFLPSIWGSALLAGGEACRAVALAGLALAYRPGGGWSGGEE